MTSPWRGVASSLAESRSIADLIGVRSILPIIHLEREEDRREALSSFVWTEDLESIVSSFLDNLQRGRGMAIFLKGHYGTGKSHLLSFVAGEAQGGWPISSQHFGRSPLEPATQISISLIEHPSHEGLEEILMGKGSGTRSERHEAWFTEQSQDGGLVILLDELSEFLRSKPSPESLNEDLRYLQFLAEWCRDHPLWLVAAIQEDLEGIGSATRETSLKLKDRFHRRWTLGRLHIADMIGQRLLEAKPGSREHISRLFLRCQELWPLSFTDPNSFASTYPLHPATLKAFEGLAPLFSEHRGALRFTLEVLQGTSPHLDEAFLNQPFYQLIGPEHLFDHFRHRFDENLEWRDLAQKAWAHLEQRVQDRIEEEDRPLALRGLKLVLLASMDPRYESISIDLLVEQLMFQVGSSTSLARDYLKQRVFDKLAGHCNYLCEKKGQWTIDLQHRTQELLLQQMEKEKLRTDLSQEGEWGDLMGLLDQRPITLAPLWKQPQALGQVIWQNTPRQPSLGFGLEPGACDIRVLLPGQFPEDLEGSALTWVPRPPNGDETVVLLEATALLRLSQGEPQTAAEHHARDEAISRVRGYKKEWTHLLENLYLSGRFFLGSRELHFRPINSASLTLEKWLEEPVFELYHQRHPLFRSVAPKLPYYNERTLADIIENIVRPGEIQESALKQKHLMDALMGVLQPLGMAMKIQSRWRFLWDPHHSPVVQAFEQGLSEEQPLAVLLDHLQEGPLGLPKDLCLFSLWACVVGEHHQALRDEEVLPSGKLSFQNLHTIEALRPYPRLSDSAMAELCQSVFFRQADQSFVGLALQRQLWQHLQFQIEKIKADLQVVSELDLQGCWSFLEALLAETREALDHVLSLIENRDMQALESLVGDVRLEDLHHGALALSNTRKLLRKKGDELPEQWQWLNDEFFDLIEKRGLWLDLQEERRQLLEETRDWSPDTWQRIENWSDAAGHWMERYRAFYRESHDRANRPSDLPWQALSEQMQKDRLLPFTTQCHRNLDLELGPKPYCRCNHAPAPPLDAVAETESDTLWQIRSSTAHLPPAFHRALDEDDPQEALRLYLEHRVQKVKRTSLRPLLRQLSKRQLTREELLRTIEEHLGGDPDTLIQLDDE